ncbi:SgcJ/EcaC family oxidoreductase [Cryptosporangium phraense]|uniref:SgcJ/EcaC family oxidoreductase n=1 Tax=Cryptosporangium phraense TaxID=2593070 RepID=A0A545AFW7_9ACTN|nr:SgcJ/EcaC family oxidoreductase [Cryptosporangium phraense]TQS40234.1 SgcJ/EcaC family oxidoreductase [Cryptosporangium phraense]
MAEVHDVLWKKYLKGSRLLGRITDIRFVTADVAVVTSVGTVQTSKRGSTKPDKVQTFVAVKRDGRWQFTAFQNTKRKPLFEWIASRSDANLAPRSDAKLAPGPAVR